MLTDNKTTNCRWAADDPVCFLYSRLDGAPFHTTDILNIKNMLWKGTHVDIYRTLCVVFRFCQTLIGHSLFLICSFLSCTCPLGKSWLKLGYTFTLLKVTAVYFTRVFFLCWTHNSFEILSFQPILPPPCYKMLPGRILPSFLGSLWSKSIKKTMARICTYSCTVCFIEDRGMTHWTHT